MPAELAVQNQINCLESGLKSLRQSELKDDPEFKDMFEAIDKHHKDIKLAHLTGKAKDLLQKAEQDTKFYYILVNMLGETLNEENKKESLNKVYSWYQQNQHVLHKKPHFGKKKKDPKSILKSGYSTMRRDSDSIRLAMTPTEKVGKPEKKAPSARAATGSQKPDLEIPDWSDAGSSRGTPVKSVAETPSPKPTVERATPSPKPERPSSETQRVRFAPGSAKNRGGSARKPRRERPSEISHLLPKRKAQPLSALYNPHGRDIEVMSDPTKEHHSPVKIHVGPADGKSKNGGMDKHIYQMRKWDAYQQEQSYGQEMLSRMQHVGRTGAPGGVRYTAHENGLMAEDYTQNVISSYAVIQEAKKQLATAERQPPKAHANQLPKALTDQTLEQFYESTENYYPPKLPKYPSFRREDKTRIQSAPTAGRAPAATDKNRAVSAKLSIRQKQADKTPEVEAEELEEVKSSVRLDTIVGMIDSVTDEMSYYKEKLAPDPQPGFRQPVAEVDPALRPQTAPAGTHARPASPEDTYRNGAGLNQCPLVCPPAPGTLSSGFRSGTAMGAALCAASGFAPGALGAYRDMDTYSNTFRQGPPIAQQVSDAIDWRGRVAPDSPTQRWDTSGFEEHTYVKKMARGKGSLRSVGKTHAGSRPKTAPMTPHEKWGAEKLPPAESMAGSYFTQQGPCYPDVPSDENERATSQAASHRDTEMDPETTASLIQIQHLGGKSRRRYRRQFLMNFDWSEPPPFKRGGNANPSMEFVSFIAPKSVVGSRVASAAQSGRMQSALTGSGSSTAPDHTNPEHLTESEYNPEHMDSVSGELDVPDMDDLDDELNALGEGGEDWQQDQTPRQMDTADASGAASGHQKRAPAVSARPYNQFGSSSEARRLIGEIHDLVGGSDRVPPDGSEGAEVAGMEVAEMEEHFGQGFDLGQFEVLKDRSVTINPDPEMYSPRHYPAEAPLPHHHLDLVLRTGMTGKPPPHAPAGPAHELCDGEQEPDDPDMALYLKQGGKVATLPAPTDAGNAPTSPRPKVFHRSFPKPVLQPDQRPSFAVEGVSANNKPRVRSAGRAPARARSATRQEMLHRQNEMLKKSSGPSRTPPSIPTAGFQPFGCRAASASSRTFMPELEAHARKEQSPRHIMERVGVLRSEGEGAALHQPAEDQTHGPLSLSLKVQRLRPEGTSESSHHPGTPVPSEDMLEDSPDERVVVGRELNEARRGNAKSLEVGTGSNKKLIHIGRPIARYGKVEDPDDYAAAVALQKETQAAVDIQRIFRGYVARSHYKYLQSDERVRRENERMAATEIQRTFRGHLSRKKAIYKRAPKKENMEWAKQYKSTLQEHEGKRLAKNQTKAYENAQKKHIADSRIAVIGPHVEVYAPFHPKKTGVDKSILNAAATAIQRRVRGWLIRVKLDKLKRKSKQHAKSWMSFIGQYKELVYRIQTRMGIEKPKFNFSFDNINSFMDTKKRYESVFDKKAFGNELDVAELGEYFKECDLYPANAEMDEAMDAVFRGQPIKKGRGLYKSEVLDITFGIYPPGGSGIVNTRRSTWMHPIIDGEEALKLVGAENVESTEFKTCWKLVAETKKEQNKRKARKEEHDREEAWNRQHKPSRRPLDTLAESDGDDQSEQTLSPDKRGNVDSKNVDETLGDRNESAALVDGKQKERENDATVGRQNKEEANMVFGELKHLTKS